ncbi:hypothetical protein [Kordiimonas sp.]|uniref:hypothetical protein n=1 Tax=Kordiimonas sp. TaxID=1970157 RepID=UPI003A900E17
MVFSHILILMLFVLIGAVGMASMQDGMTLVFKRLHALIKKQPWAVEVKPSYGRKLTF